MPPEEMWRRCPTPLTEVAALEGMNSRGRESWFQVQSPPFTDCMTLCKLLEPQFSLLPNGVIVPILWVSVRTEGGAAVSGLPGQCLEHGWSLPSFSTKSL